MPDEEKSLNIVQTRRTQLIKFISKLDLIFKLDLNLLKKRSNSHCFYVFMKSFYKNHYCDIGKYAVEKTKHGLVQHGNGK